MFRWISRPENPKINCYGHGLASSPPSRLDDSSTLLSMRHSLTVLASLVFSAFLAGPFAALATAAPEKIPDQESLHWETDYAAALKQAKTENRHVFLFFTGSDWCGWCKRLNKEILSTPEFAQYSKGKLILVELDFPKKRKLTANLKAQNAKLAAKYKIEGYPTIIVLDSSGAKVGELGYQEGGPGPFIASLGKF